MKLITMQGNIVLALELAKRYGDEGIISTALNPGNIRSDLLRHVPNLVQQTLVILRALDRVQH
jgi:retinol dehydrogenase-12